MKIFFYILITVFLSSPCFAARRTHSMIASADLVDNGQMTMDNSMSPGSLLYYPCQETSGGTIADIVTGNVFGIKSGPDPTYAVSNAVTFLGGITSEYTVNNLGVYTSGLLIWFFSANFLDVEGDSGKCSLVHVEPFALAWDIQINHNTTTNISISQLGVVPGPTAALQLAGADHFEGRTVTGAIVSDIGDAGVYIYFSNGDKFTVDEDFTFSSVDVSTTTPRGAPFNDTIESTPAFRLIDLFVAGLYLFAVDTPTDAQIFDFLEWMDTNAQNGVKTGYLGFLTFQ